LLTNETLADYHNAIKNSQTPGVHAVVAGVTSNVLRIEKQKAGDNISYGLSSFGYDARVSNEFKIFTDVDSAVVDPKNFNKNSFVSRTSKECIIPPNSFALASTVEYFKIPNDVLVICASGERSQITAELLSRENYKSINISDGFMGSQEGEGWKNNGLPCL